MKKRMISVLLATVLVLCTLCGCSANEGNADTSADQTAAGTTTLAGGENGSTSDTAGESVTLRLCWWGSQTRNDLTQKAIELYMEKNPNVVIETEFTDWSGYWDKLATQAAGGGLPDIIQMDYSYLNQYASSNQLADLNGFIESGVIDTENISSSIIESGSVNGKCYALSLGSTAPMVLYDKATADAAGVEIPMQPTLEEYVDICQKIYEKTGVPSYFESGITMIQYIARSRGSEIYEELENGVLYSTLEHFQWVEKLAQAEFCISPELLSEKNPQVVESMPIIDLSTWNVFSFSNAYVSINDACGGERELGVFMYPTLPDEKKQPEYLKPTMFFSVTETSKYKEEAAKFIDWFVNDEECNAILGGERGIPANTAVAESVKGQVDAIGAVAYDFVAEVNKVATTVDPPNPAGYSEVEAVLTTLVEDIRYGNLTAQEAAKQFVPQAQTILKEAAQ